MRALILLVLLALAGFAEEKKKKYNILFISADDLNCDMGSYGNKLVKTPFLDQLAKTGEPAYSQYIYNNKASKKFL